MAGRRISSGPAGALGPDLAVAIDVGGTKVAAAVVDREGLLRHRVQIPTSQESAQVLLDQVVSLACDRLSVAARDGTVRGIGVSVAGAVEPETGTVVWAPNLPNWRDVPLGRLLRETTGLRTFVDFDGHLSALGEYWKGAGRDVRNMIFIIVGTGVGGGLILDGRLYRGSSNIAGAAGWMIVDPRAAELSEAREVGSLEGVAAGPAIVRAAERMVAEGKLSSLRSPITMPGILDAAQAGDAVARAVLEHAAQALASAVANVVSLLNPDLVVLGGGVGCAASIFVERARETTATLAQPISARAVRVVTAQRGDEAGLLGAAHIVFQSD